MRRWTAIRCGGEVEAVDEPGMLPGECGTLSVGPRPSLRVGLQQLYGLLLIFLPTAYRFQTESCKLS